MSVLEGSYPRCTYPVATMLSFHNMRLLRAQRLDHTTIQLASEAKLGQKPMALESHQVASGLLNLPPYLLELEIPSKSLSTPSKPMFLSEAH